MAAPFFRLTARWRFALVSLPLLSATTCVWWVLLANGNIGQLLARLMSNAIVQEHRAMMLSGSTNAEERVANFLLEMSTRMQERGCSARGFHLRMTRAEIGSYLGSTLETVSRTQSALHQRDLLDIDRKHIRIVDRDGLSRVFGIQVH